MKAIDVIGIGQSKKDLTKRSFDLIEACDILIGGEQQLSEFDYLNKEKVIIKKDIKKIIKTINEKTL